MLGCTAVNVTSPPAGRTAVNVITPLAESAAATTPTNISATCTEARARQIEMTPPRASRGGALCEAHAHAVHVHAVYVHVVYVHALYVHTNTRTQWSVHDDADAPRTVTSLVGCYC